MDDQIKLQQIIKASGLSQQALAEKLGTSLVSVNNWLNGKATPTRRHLISQIDLLHLHYLGVESVDQQQLQDLKRKAAKSRLTVKKLIQDRQLLDQLTLNLTYHTNTIEGSTMTKSDVAAVLFDDKTLRNRTQIEQLEAINHRVALEFLLNELARDPQISFTSDLIKRTHLLLMNGILSNAGHWRNHGVRIQGTRVVVANFIKIPELINNLCNQLNDKSADSLELLARTHAIFEKIHPFSDGNGRVGRLVMFAKAPQLGLIPPIIPKERKAIYYRYLELAQTQDVYDNLEQLLAETILATAQDINQP